MANSWVLALGVLAVFAAFSYFVDPNTLLKQNALGQALRGWAYAWNVLYFLGGVCIVYGVVALNRAIDIAGQFFMAGALFVNVICILFLRGGAAAASAPGLIALGVAALLRARFLYLSGKL